MSKVTSPLGQEWADPDQSEVQALIEQSAASGWRTALEPYREKQPFFVRRMTNLSLANWHVLLLKERESATLDIGCGFGSLALGLGEYYRRAIGVDALHGRVAYAALRQRQDRRPGTAFLQGSGLELPFASGSFDLTTINGVLEWAGYHAAGDPRTLQLTMLREARRVLRPGGTTAVAIENRFAMETLAGLPDTHTGLNFVPALPRRLADVATRLLAKRPYRTYLYHPRGYAGLLREAGYAQVRVLDLVSSYNDYDFVVDIHDRDSYAFLWARGLVRTFYPWAGTARRLLSRTMPGLLGQVSYAYLVLAGEQVTTILDTSHPVWKHGNLATRVGQLSRFACPGEKPGTLAVILHDTHQARFALELGIEQHLAERNESCLPRELSERLLPSACLIENWREGSIGARFWQVPEA